MDPGFRQDARRRIVATYFPPDEQVALYAALGLPVPSTDELTEIRQDQAAYKAQLHRGRDARFKVSVISGYHFTWPDWVPPGRHRFELRAPGGCPHGHSQLGPDSPDNGAVSIARTVRDGLAKRGIRTLYIDPGSPCQNDYVESFNSLFRDECLNGDQLYTLSEARVVISDWIAVYNVERPYGGVGYLTPNEPAARSRASGPCA